MCSWGSRTNKTQSKVLLIFRGSWVFSLICCKTCYGVRESTSIPNHLWLSMSSISWACLYARGSGCFEVLCEIHCDGITHQNIFRWIGVGVAWLMLVWSIRLLELLRIQWPHHWSPVHLYGSFVSIGILKYSQTFLWVSLGRERWGGWGHKGLTEAPKPHLHFFPTPLVVDHLLNLNQMLEWKYLSVNPSIVVVVFFPFTLQSQFNSKMLLLPPSTPPPPPPPPPVSLCL